MSKVHYGDRWYRWRECLRKRPYSEPTKAMLIQAEGDGLRFYRCTSCGYWHRTKNVAWTATR